MKYKVLALLAVAFPGCATVRMSPAELNGKAVIAESGKAVPHASISLAIRRNPTTLLFPAPHRVEVTTTTRTAANGAFTFRGMSPRRLNRREELILILHGQTRVVAHGNDSVVTYNDYDQSVEPGSTHVVLRIPQAATFPLGWGRYLEDRPISRDLAEAVTVLARGDGARWNELAGIWRAHRLDGIVAECFDAGVAELFARAPLLFLERYLSGDDTAAELAKLGAEHLGWGQVLPNARAFRPKEVVGAAKRLIAQRYQVASDLERIRIKQFVAYVFSS